ncbi:MAG: PQQ-binding-like beta-propeller repeat protein, partial [Planctomycetes bacterium]|nr:PQQ-binding-like beta-propeller repeat protein [Planctomycetota bacterium]
PETGLPATWSRTDGVAWSAALPGPGDATPIIVGDRVFVSSTDAASKALVGMCLSAAEGKVLWQTRLGTDAKAPRNTMASPSPVADGRVVVFLYGTGEMAGLDPAGTILWRRSLGDEFGKVSIKYGYSSSPLLYDGRLYVLMLRRPWAYKYNPGRATPAEERRQLDSFLLALDPMTGKTLWRHVRPTEAVDESFESYNTPVPWRAWAARTDLVISGGDYVTGHDPATGAERWRWGYNPEHKNMQRLIPSPTPDGDWVFVPLPRGNRLAALAPDGRGVGLAWDLDGPTTDSATPLFHAGTLFVLDSDRKDLAALDPATGAQRWRTKLGGAVWRASPTGADGKVYCFSVDGEVVVLDAKTGEILSRIDMAGKEVRSTIAVAGGRLYIRTHDRLWCVGK